MGSRPLRGEGALPNLIVIGAPKCGTTSLHRYLDLHPEIAMAPEKELDFFVEERNWSRGEAWYRARFDAAAPVRGEASPKYALHPVFRGVPERMRALVPDARLVYVVRDPIERLVSDYVHRLSTGWWPATDLAGALRDPAGERLLAGSRYATQLRRYLEHYPAERILLVDADDLDRRRGATLAEVFRFAGVEPGFRDRRFAARLNRTSRRRRTNRLGRLVVGITRPLVDGLPHRWRGRARWLSVLPFSRRIERPRLDPGLRRELAAELAPEVAWLREWSGRALAGWSL